MENCPAMLPGDVGAMAAACGDAVSCRPATDEDGSDGYWMPSMETDVADNVGSASDARRSN